MNHNTYRPCVLAVFVRDDKKVLLGQRSDHKAWQFPQGGIEPHEKPEEALYREVKEEIGCDTFKILKKTPKQIKYDFPPHLKRPISNNYRGQVQDWFLCSFNEGTKPDLQFASSSEFIDLRWLSVTFAIDNIVYWKKESYKEGLKHFELL